MTAYLDHSATSPLRANAREAMLRALDAGGNASSIHAPGRAARAILDAARDTIARFAGACADEIVFTSGGTEANVAALRGAVRGAFEEENRITRIFVSSIEHDSVRATAVALGDSVPGLKISEIPVTADGVVDPHQFRLQIMQGKGRALVSVMAVNNETGALQPIDAIAAIVRSEGGEDSLLHIDAVQAAGTLPLDFAASGADYMTLSAHKIGGPHGAGALLIKSGAPFARLLTGGAQESRRRGGTENVAAIAGFAAAARAVMENSEAARFAALRERFESGLRRIAPDAVIFAARAPRAPHISNVAVPGLSAETALIALDLDGVAVSSGAACSSGKVGPSHVLSAMGVADDLARSSLRISLGWSSQDHDVDAALVSLSRLIARKASRAA